MNQLFTVWNALTIGRKITAVAATIGVFLAIMAMARIVSAPSMSLLYSGLESSAAGEVVSALEARGVQHSVRGGAIFVEAGQRDSLRLTLASEGLPANGSGGYELLDNLSGFGTTSQMFDAAYWRAKEGEIARTIVASSHIKSARVHIANGGSSPFQRGVKPTASVAISSSGGDISSGQAKALKFLVASAIAGLAPEDVAVIGDDGALLASSEEPEQGNSGDDRAKSLKEKVERLLEARVGVGNAVVEVSVDTVTQRESIRERSFDPDSRVAISTDTEEVTNESSQAAQGQVSVASNLPDGDAAGGEGSNSQNNQTRERINYEVSETEREVVRVPGSVKRLSVAVLVNGTSVTNDDGTTNVEPRDEEEIGALRELVESAVGYDESRGDVITIKSMGLQVVEPMGTQVSSSAFDGLHFDLMAMIQMAVLAVVTLILGLFVVRPVLSKGAALDTSRPTALIAETPVSEEFPSDSNALALDGELGSASDPLPDLNLGLPMGTGDNLVGDLPPLNMAMGEDNPADRLRTMIDERQTETVEILKTWLEDKEEIA